MQIKMLNGVIMDNRLYALLGILFTPYNIY